MKSSTTPDFWKTYAALPPEINLETAVRAFDGMASHERYGLYGRNGLNLLGESLFASIESIMSIVLD